MSSASVRRVLALAPALAALLLASTLLCAPAHAEAPFRLPTQVVDPAGALDGTQSARVWQAVYDVDGAHDIQYWVVYVKNFGGLAPEDWVAKTVRQSDFGAHDVVLAIATEPRDYVLQAPVEVEGLTAEETDRIISDDLAPAVDQGRFADAAVVVGEDIADVGGEPESSRAWWIALAVVVLVLLAVGAALLLLLRRRRAAAEHADAFTADQLGQKPVGELDPWSREVLTTTDRAIRNSGDEAVRARDERGTAADPFISAVADARAAIAASYMLRQRLDDDQVSDPADQRRMLVEIITTCSNADAMLDGRSTALDSLRDLSADGERRLDALSTAVVEATDRIPEIESGLAELASTPPEVDGNLTLARHLLDFARECTDQGRDAAAAGQRGSVIGAIRSAEGALDQATRLLNAAEDADDTPRSTGLSDVVDLVRAASTYVQTRRGVVGSVAFTRLSEARRLADVAADLADTDSDGSAGTAARAADLASQALDAAAADVADWWADQVGAPSDLAPVLAGVLVDSVLIGSVHDGGYSHDGRSPASFGGSSSAGRIGVGERV
ncbi:TPM domain-containing protein [Gordonia sp. HY002]|uniref:TPM domain-containing protein n=1 Tax=Gordonia zhenghanii TaxID=2911516 RepID=UPI001EF032F1|nr:TPM domain-containing protein [Gordonia zhenghanii]MCF8571969.1 TPM domain-containing protein [Gordonia zhenghanii]MCF8604187.1 TPM domain-containing protein [Gordonia zhenghanii]